MCLRPRIVVNPHLVKLAGSSSGAVEMFHGSPELYFRVDCGLCIECLAKWSRMWRTRLIDEYNYFIKGDKSRADRVSFVTLTIAPEHYSFVKSDPSRAIRLFLERYRKLYGVSVRHWICSEYGERRGRYHFHAIFFGCLCSKAILEDLWSYGFVSMSKLQSQKGLTYVSKYITKYVEDIFIKPGTKTRVWTSPGFGKLYVYSPEARSFHFQLQSPLFVRLDPSGMPMSLPRYYYDKLFSPVDLYRRKRDFIKLMSEHPRPPFKAHKRRFTDLVQYFSYLRMIGGEPSYLPSEIKTFTNKEKFALIYG